MVVAARRRPKLERGETCSTLSEVTYDIVVFLLTIDCTGVLVDDGSVWELEMSVCSSIFDSAKCIWDRPYGIDTIGTNHYKRQLEPWTKPWKFRESLRKPVWLCKLSHVRIYIYISYNTASLKKISYRWTTDEPIPICTTTWNNLVIYSCGCTATGMNVEALKGGECCGKGLASNNTTWRRSDNRTT